MGELTKVIATLEAALTSPLSSVDRGRIHLVIDELRALEPGIEMDAEEEEV